MRNCKSAIVLLILLFCIMLSAMAYEKTDADVVSELILARTEILSDYYTSQTNKRYTIRQLETVETGSLLTQDTENLKTYFRTDIDAVTGCEIKDVTFTLQENDLLCAVVVIHWTNYGVAGEDAFQRTYSVICKKEGETFKLTQFF